MGCNQRGGHVLAGKKGKLTERKPPAPGEKLGGSKRRKKNKNCPIGVKKGKGKITNRKKGKKRATQMGTKKTYLYEAI